VPARHLITCVLAGLCLFTHVSHYTFARGTIQYRLHGVPSGRRTEIRSPTRPQGQAGPSMRR
jgi:hypothetical protein